ncbi:hypothetical protein [Actinoplanes sp. NPDC020271]|uniref:hypothetical protein n=1 Tax=Actinoplanes sp. NPDC020271 TaxID=3363896 RepID=UPI0037926B87
MSEVVEEELTLERRAPRIGSVSGLALMTGATAMAAVGGGHHSVFATILLALLALGMAHAFTVEIQRQAHRRTGRWGRNDLINTVLLASWAVTSLTIALLPYPPVSVRVLGLLLTFSYAAAAAYFVAERHHAITAASTRTTAAVTAASTRTTAAVTPPTASEPAAPSLPEPAPAQPSDRDPATPSVAESANA